jgi:hypothetical protein
MPLLTPPRPPVSVTVDDEDLRRLHFRLWQILMATITVLVTTWFVTFGVIPAVIALMIAKHVLVAILVQGLDQPMKKCRLQIADCRLEDNSTPNEG